MATVSGNETRQVLLSGTDITDWVIDIPTTPNKKPDWGQIPSLPLLNLQVRSNDFAFHPTHAASFLKGKRLDTMSLQVKQFGNVQWDGFLVDAPTDLQKYRTTLIGEPTLQQQINRSARLDSDLLTPAEAGRQLLILHNVPVDNSSFSKADSILDDIPCRVRVNPDVLTWQGTLADLLQLLASAGIGRFYLTQAGKIGFDTYLLEDSPTVSYTVTDDDFYQWPKENDESMEKLVGYKVTYLYDFASDSDLTKNIQTLNFGSESAVQMVTNASAAYTGSQWVALSQRQYNRLEIHLDKTFGMITTLSTWININSDILGLSNRSAEVIGIDNSDPRWVKLTLRIDKGIN